MTNQMSNSVDSIRTGSYLPLLGTTAFDYEASAWFDASLFRPKRRYASDHALLEAVAILQSFLLPRI
jgi:hypothetical protein